METVLHWKNPELRSHEGRAEHPSGVVELSDDDMQLVAGGSTAWCVGIVTATIVLTFTKCSPDGTLCGSCQMGTRGCC